MKKPNDHAEPTKIESKTKHQSVLFVSWQSPSTSHNFPVTIRNNAWTDRNVIVKASINSKFCNTLWVFSGVRPYSHLHTFVARLCSTTPSNRVSTWPFMCTDTLMSFSYILLDHYLRHNVLAILNMYHDLFDVPAFNHDISFCSLRGCYFMDVRTQENIPM